MFLWIVALIFDQQGRGYVIWVYEDQPGLLGMRGSDFVRLPRGSKERKRLEMAYPLRVWDVHFGLGSISGFRRLRAKQLLWLLHFRECMRF